MEKKKYQWTKKHEYMWSQGALVKRPSGRTDEEVRELASAMKAPRGHVPKREHFNSTTHVDTEPQDYVGPEGKISLKKNAKWTNKDEDKWEKEHIGEYSKDKYWIHKDKSWGIKPRGRVTRW